MFLVKWSVLDCPHLPCVRTFLLLSHFLFQLSKFIRNSFQIVVILSVQRVVFVELGLVQPPLVRIDNGGELYQVVLCIALVYLHVRRGSGHIGVRGILTIGTRRGSDDGAKFFC